MTSPLASTASGSGGGPDWFSDWFSGLITWIYQQQRAAHDVMAQDLQAIAGGDLLAASAGLILASFAYGVLHAAGPGHGKAVITTYLTTQPEKRRRGVILSFAAAAVQGLTAILLVYGLIHVAGWLPRETKSAVLWSERAAFALAAVLGGLLLIRGAWALAKRFRHSHAAKSGHGHFDHGHFDHEHSECCHAHGPTAEQIDRAGSPWAAIGIVFAIGLRPCTGAVLVLVLAQVLALSWAGILAVMAMSLGTAFTISGIALVSTTVRGWVGRLSQAGTGGRLAFAGDTVSMLGGGVLLVLGGALLQQSFAPVHPLGL
ncbi:MAG: high frequency lysogenization protein HflD [Alphaproteobacteria bacterium]|nr:high frequency lysogenization protein HflD [Alphaproteobacteria bacterium]